MKSFISWQDETKWDLHSPYPSHPHLMKTPYDFRLQSNSPALQAGTLISVPRHEHINLSVDILGNKRDVSNPSIGAVD